MNTYYVAGLPCSDELYHHGILGQKWGVRRFQNPDGSLTTAGRERYGVSRRALQRDLNRLDKERAYAIGDKYKATARMNRAAKKLNAYEKRHGYESDEVVENDKKHERLKSEQDRYVNQVLDSYNQIESLEKQAKDLVDSMKGMNYSIVQTPTGRATVRNGEIVARSILSSAMAIGTAMINPVGIGIGYGGRYTSPTMGTKYKVYQNISTT